MRFSQFAIAARSSLRSPTSCLRREGGLSPVEPVRLGSAQTVLSVSLSWLSCSNSSSAT